MSWAPKALTNVTCCLLRTRTLLVPEGRIPTVLRSGVHKASIIDMIPSEAKGCTFLISDASLIIPSFVLLCLLSVF